MRALVTAVLFIVSFVLGVAYHRISHQQPKPDTQGDLIHFKGDEATPRQPGSLPIIANGELLAVCDIDPHLQIKNCKLKGKHTLTEAVSALEQERFPGRFRSDENPIVEGKLDCAAGTHFYDNRCVPDSDPRIGAR
jgi:hypothetical protein